MVDEVQVHEPTRRIVLWQRQGTHAGLWHILGTDEGFEGATPVSVENVAYPDGHQSSADLFKSTKRAHVYRERVEA